MLEKIVSGGQTGADRAALDVAMKFNIDHGGWIPRGRITEDGHLPLKYRLIETGTDDYRQRTRQNIIDSHGTVIISRGDLTGGSAFTRTFAGVKGRPSCYIDLMQAEEFEAALILNAFIMENQIRILNVAGPRQSHLPGIYRDVKTVLELSLYLFFLDTRQDLVMRAYIPPGPVREDFPESLEDSMDILYQDMPLKTRLFIARSDAGDIRGLYFILLDHIRHRLGFDRENKPLLRHCAAVVEEADLSVEDAVMVILKHFKANLEKDHLLRVVQ